MPSTEYRYLLVETVGAERNVILITLNRPGALNALSAGLLEELADCMAKLDKNDEINVAVITGSKKAFCAGADIKEMSRQGSKSMTNFTRVWSQIAAVKKPVIVAVNGIAFGGGCELAMTFDIIYAGESASFAQPEVRIGVTPGAGGTQRLPRYTNKSIAMEMCLSGEPMSAKRMFEAGLVGRILPDDMVVPEAIGLAERIARLSPVTVGLCKDSVNQAYEVTLAEGLRYETLANLHSFQTAAQKEGMSAFIEKRKPNFKNVSKI